MISLFCFTTLLPTHGSIVSGNARAILTQECWKPGHNCNSLQLNHMITINIISVLLTICCTFRGHLSLGRRTSSCTLYKASNTIQSIGTVHTFQCFISLSSWHLATLSLDPQNCWPDNRNMYQFQPVSLTRFTSRQIWGVPKASVVFADSELRPPFSTHVEYNRTKRFSKILLSLTTSKEVPIPETQRFAKYHPRRSHTPSAVPLHIYLTCDYFLALTTEPF